MIKIVIVIVKLMILIIKLEVDKFLEFMIILNKYKIKILIKQK